MQDRRKGWRSRAEGQARRDSGEEFWPAFVRLWQK
jgi:hypothetical protein